MFRSFLIFLTGCTSLAAGAVFLPLPTPFGVPLLLVGMALIVMASPSARTRLKAWRSTHRKSSAILERYEPYLPRAMRNAFDATHPGARLPGNERSETSNERDEPPPAHVEPRPH